MSAKGAAMLSLVLKEMKEQYRGCLDRINRGIELLWNDSS
jgi:hypothetical protein